MKNNNIQQIDNKYIESKSNQLSILRSIRKVSQEIIFKPENEKEVILFIKNNLDKDKFISSLDNIQKESIAKLGLQIIQNELDTKIINTETDIQKYINNINETKFLDLFSKKILSLKQKIEANKQEFNNINEQNISNSQDLNKVAKLINPTHSILIQKSIDTQVNDFLNGDDIEL